MTHSLLVFQGPSASGKTTLQARLGIPRVVTWTSRPARANEVHGIDYFFSTRERMASMKEQGLFLEVTAYGGELYGTPFESIRRIFREGDRRTIILDAHGARKLKELYPDEVLLVGIHASKEDCRKRLVARGSEAEADKRLQTYEEEADALSQCDLILANSDANRRTAEAVVDWLRSGLTMGGQAAANGG